MSSYTMPLRAYIEQFSQGQTGLTHREKIEIGRQHLFDFDYPIFDEDYKKAFETKFIRHFYFREIGFETEENFKFHLETELNQQMPYYNKLFESELIEFDPMANTEMDTVQKREGNTTSKSNTSGNSNSQTKGSSDSDTNSERTNDDFKREIDADVPDNRLALTTNDGQGTLEYASHIQENTVNNKDSVNSSQNENSQASNNTTADSSSDANIDNTEDYLQHRSGKTGDKSYSKLLQEYRDTFLRIENQIFSEFEQLFMLLY